MWSIKQRRTKPRTVGNKVIYPKFNATSKPNRYVNRNTYLDVKCNRDKGAGCTIVGCQCSKYTDQPCGWREGPANTDNKNWSGITSSADGTKLAACVNGGNIWTSTDSGETWMENTTSPNTTKTWRSITSSADGTKLAACVNNGNIWTSTDSGATFFSRASSRYWNDITSSTNGEKLAAVAGRDFGSLLQYCTIY